MKFWVGFYPILWGEYWVVFPLSSWVVIKLFTLLEKKLSELTYQQEYVKRLKLVNSLTVHYYI